MGQTDIGAIKVAARRVGFSVKEYKKRLSRGLKWCTACKQWHPKIEFGTDPSRRDGLAAKCANARIVKVSKRAGPGIRERRKRAHFGQAWCSKCAVWTQKDDVRGGLCSMHRRAWAAEYYETNRTKLSARSHRRRLSVEPMPTIGVEYLTEMFGGMCAYCDRPARTWDHLTAVSAGGITEPGNMVPACKSCNSSKGAKPLFVWLQGRPIKDELLNAIDLWVTMGNYDGQ